MQFLVVFCFMAITSKPLVLKLRSSTDSNARTRTSVVGSFDYKSAITSMFRVQNFEVATYTELIT